MLLLLIGTEVEATAEPDQFGVFRDDRRAQWARTDNGSGLFWGEPSQFGNVGGGVVAKSIWGK